MRIACMFLGLSLAACVADAPDEAGSDSGGKADGSGSGHKLPGHDETMLVGSADGQLAVIHVGAAFTKRAVILNATQGPNVVRAKDGKFYALLDSGTLAVIDEQTANVERTIEVGAAPQDLEWSAAGALYVTTGSTVLMFDFAASTPTATLDLASLANPGGSVQTRRMLRIDDRLYVQVARRSSSGRAENGALAVIKAGVIEKTIELEGLEPDFALVHDTRRGILYVTCTGVRPIDTGTLVRIDTGTLAVHDRIKAESGWQGIVQFADPFEILFMIYHTSTPTTSSHLFAFAVDDAGTMRDADPTRGAIVDAFDGLDALAMNADGTLVAMANHCLVGFCFGGAGINFIDIATQQKQQKLLKAELGFEPALIEFSR
jgi:hypothetical protein